MSLKSWFCCMMPQILRPLWWSPCRVRRVLPPPKGYLKRLREICDAHNLLLIFDEVITGLEEWAPSTGAEEFGVTPDILTLAKITNGAQPLGAVLSKQEIYDTYMDQGGPIIWSSSARIYVFCHRLPARRGLPHWMCSSVNSSHSG